MPLLRPLRLSVSAVALRAARDSVEPEPVVDADNRAVLSDVGSVHDMLSYDLQAFITESNRIEGLGPAHPREIAAHTALLAELTITIDVLERFVTAVAGAALRSKLGMNVRVGNHLPSPGGRQVVADLEALLSAIRDGRLTPWEAHQRYETLHPFMDGNGRSGRALWLWMMGGISNVPLGFLHTWYYQSLQAQRNPLTHVNITSPLVSP
jgi:hypothetical protein